LVVDTAEVAWGTMAAHSFRLVRVLQTFADVTDRLPRFIEDVYKRMHSSIGYQSPNKFEAQLAQQAA
jgi:hypothetical protein